MHIVDGVAGETDYLRRFGFRDARGQHRCIDTDHDGRYDTGETYTDVNGNGHWDADMAAQGYGDANDIVVYTVTYPWKINTPMVSQFFSNDGELTLSASAVVKNEPY